MALLGLFWVSLLLPSSLWATQGYYNVVPSTSVGTSTMSLAGFECISASSLTFDTCKIYLNGTNGGISGSSIAITGAGNFGGINIAGNQVSTNPVSVWSINGANIYNNNSGNVGMGTQNPQSGLHVAGSGTTDISVSSSANAAAANSRIFFRNFQNTGDDIDIGYRNATTVSHRLYIDTSGNVGIGTTGPGEVLEVNGGIWANNSGSGTLYGNVLPANTNTQTVCYGNTSGKRSIGTCTSDERLKRNIHPLSNQSMLVSVLNLNPVEYTWKESGEKAHGFIAQQVKKAIPLGAKKAENGFYSLDNTAIIAHLVGAIKEQQKEIEELKSRIKRLEH